MQTCMSADTSEDAEAEANASVKLPVFRDTYFLYTKCEGLFVSFIHIVIQLLNPVVLPMITLCDDLVVLG